MRAVVTGGSGYFGERLVDRLLALGHQVVVLDLNPPDRKVEFVQADVRDAAAVEAAFRGAEVVFHNVAQVPVVKNPRLFWEVNREGTRNVLEGSLRAGVRRFVYTSSSAVFGIPAHNPVGADTPCRPREAYGKAKLAGETLCREYFEKGLDVGIVRPRTILGHGRLGIFSVLFDWVSRGSNVPVLGRGDNLYQFVHADDLAEAVLLAGQDAGWGVFHCGTDRFGTMGELLGALCRHAGTGSRVRSIPRWFGQPLLDLAARLPISPIAPYHALMYGRSMHFDIRPTPRRLEWQPRYSNEEMLLESYDWFLANRHRPGSSPHKSLLKQGMLAVVRWLL